MKRIKILFMILPVLLFGVRFNAAESKAIFHSDSGGEKKIALTFDDGPHPRHTNEILDILDKYGIKATFFFIGQNIGYYPEPARAAVERGHEIGNHTFTHHNIKSMRESDILSELSRCDDMIYSLGEYRSVLFRPPEGAFGADIEKAADIFGYSVILWSVDTRDWAHAAPECIYENVMQNIDGGDIILMHDYISERSPTVAALELIIPELQKRGYEFVTVSELIKTSEE